LTVPGQRRPCTRGVRSFRAFIPLLRRIRPSADRANDPDPRPQCGSLPGPHAVTPQDSAPAGKDTLLEYLQNARLAQAGGGVQDEKPPLPLFGPRDRRVHHSQHVLTAHQERPPVLVRAAIGLLPGRTPLSGRADQLARRSQGYVLPQDLLLQSTNLRGRADSQLSRQRVPQSRRGGQRLRLPSAAVQGQHEQPPSALAERVLADEAGGALSHRDGPAEVEVGLQEQLGRVEPELGEAGRLLPGERHALQPRQRRADTQRQRLLQQPAPRRDARHVAALQIPSRGRDQPFEPRDVDLLGIERQDPTRRPGQDPGCLLADRRHRSEDAAQTRHVRLKAQGRPGGGLVAPELVHEAIQGNDASSVESHQREHRTLFRAAKRKFDAARRRGDGAEQRHLHVFESGRRPQ
jgi:hypothetical protein